MKLIFLLLVLATVVSGCGHNCDKEAKKYRTFDYNLHVESHYSIGRLFLIEGIDVQDGNRHQYTDVGSWYPSFAKFIVDGDTVVKHKNELIFYIHKKDTVLSFPFICAGKIIN